MPHREKFHRPQHLQMVPEVFGVGGGPVPVAVLKQDLGGIGGERLVYRPKDAWECRRSTEERHGWSSRQTRVPTVREQILGTAAAAGLPDWIKKERQVLHFESFFLEPVDSDRVETERVRKCHLYFYLEDESLQVVEPAVPNSGIPQGTLVRRHRVPFHVLPEERVAPDGLPRPTPRMRPEAHITYWDLNPGCDIIIYGHRHKIVDCDDFTKKFLSAQGILVNPAEPLPGDKFEDHRNRVESVQARRPYKRAEAAKQFEAGEGRVLRFYGRWTDSSGPATDTRLLEVRFHLEDETVEVAEIHDVNCGRYKAPLFLKRSKIPKDVKKLVALPGSRSDHTLLNVVRSKGPGRQRDAILIDNLETKVNSPISDLLQPNPYFSETDFEIGREIPIIGRNVLLYDCDEFTRNYYKLHHKKALEKIDLAQEVKKDRIKQVPPYTGFGSEEDSLTSCQGLEPRPPERDFFKFIYKDSQGFDSHILRFCGRLLIDGKIDQKRKFVIAYFLCDDTILVTLVPEENSGRFGGRFLQRGKVRKPAEDQSPDLSLDSLYYTSKDLYVGAIVTLNKHTFLLTAADEYVFSYMEREGETENYPQSNIRTILEAVLMLVKNNGGPKHLMATYIKNDPEDCGFVSEKIFRMVLHEFVGYNLSEHQIITVIRRYRYPDATPASLPNDTLFSILQTELKRINFLGFNELRMAFKAKDVECTGKLPKEQVRLSLIAGCAAAKSKLRGQNVNHLINSIFKNLPDGDLGYDEIITRMDWLKKPALPVAPQLVKSNYDDKSRPVEFAPVNYKTFVRQLESMQEPKMNRYIYLEEPTSHEEKSID